MEPEAKLGLLKAVDLPKGEGEGLFSVFFSLCLSLSGDGETLGD